MSKLILLRHGESEYNEKGLWTGWDDPDLDLKGVEQAEQDAENLKNIHIDYVYTSVLRRVKETLEEIKEKLYLSVPTIESAALNERNYGIYTGKNKWEIEKEIGEKEFTKLRRSWDYPIEQGESLKQVYERAIPYFTAEILPKLKSGKNVLIVSSGNALRSLVKYLEHIPDQEIASVEIATGELLIYTFDHTGMIINKEIQGNSKNTV